MRIRFLLPLSFALLAAPLAALAEPATGAQIRAALAGNTVTGSMAASGSYDEFYATDGTLRAADYQGRWSVEGDRMCLAYDGASAPCFGLDIRGAQVIWLGPDGTEEGTGTIRTGNPGGF